MNIIFLLLLFFISMADSVKIKPSTPSRPNKTIADIKKSLEQHELNVMKSKKTKHDAVKITNYEKVKLTPIPVMPDKTEPPKIVTSKLVQEWAEEISKSLLEMEARVVRREELIKGFTGIRMEVRNGSAIVDRMAKEMKDLLIRRVKAAEEIMRKAEEIAAPKQQPPKNYTFDNSMNLDEAKKKITKLDYDKWELPLTCRSPQKMKLSPSKHYDAPVSLDKTSVHVSAEVFDCDSRVLPHIYWSEGLTSTFQKNYAQDSTIDFQYFCSASGFLRHYPAAVWSSMFKQTYDPESDIYDCRLRPWFVSAEGAPRDVLILLDASGSMNNSTNRYVSDIFTLALLSALTDDDRVNVLRFNVMLESPISCFEDKLVPANHVNTAAMIAALKPFPMNNETWMEDILISAVRLLRQQRGSTDRPPACQQAIVLLTDSLYSNYTDLMREIDPLGKIRLFTLWLHDPKGLRDNTRQYGHWLSCDRDGYFAELITHADVTEQVMRILRVMERPLVHQRKERLRVFSDVYAHVEDPRRGEEQWKMKENAEQAFRYRQLRIDKDKLLSPQQMAEDHWHQTSLDKYGYYYEAEDVNYRLQISVSVPVFENTTLENITIVLDEEKQRNATRTYPVNRLLGVAGVDIPLDHLKLILPFHQLGGGGTLFILDHRGNIVLHDNIKPTFEGDILKPGYRTVDFLDLEQPANSHPPRHYPRDWLEFRKAIIIDKEKGNMTMYGKNVFENGLRVHMEMREYHWKRVLDHYTAVVVIPPYNRHHIVPETTFTKELAEEALRTLSRTEFAVHPDWLYCRHIEPHFETREDEVRHFIRRRLDEPNFAMKKTKYEFSPIPPTLLEKTYQCDEGLMAKLCKEAIATNKWALEHEEHDTERDCSTCELGSTTAFFASESGLTRWQQYHATSQHAPPPNAAVWSRGPTESWYRRAAANPGTLIVHAPVSPVRLLRNTFLRPPPIGVKFEWLTAARALSTDKGLLGVAGYHFYPQHLLDLLMSVTNFPCTEKDKTLCKPTCSDEWSCVLVDEGGWVVSRYTSNNVTKTEEVREHLATLHPAALSALLNAKVFELNWIHDYQGVCFPPWDQDNAAPMMPSLIRSVWHSAKLMFQMTQKLIILLALVTSSALVSAETEKEREKRRNSLYLKYAREKYDRLYDHRVLINKTVFVACDRTRATYQLQNNPKSIEALSKTPTLSQLEDCSWPLVGAIVPNTNLLLLALYNCEVPYTGKQVPNPLINEQYMEEDQHFWRGRREIPAGRLACWRNRVQLPTRPPNVKCFPHNYTEEKGYRQCGPWDPDPEEVEDNAASLHTSKKLFSLMLIATTYMALNVFNFRV